MSIVVSIVIVDSDSGVGVDSGVDSADSSCYVAYCEAPPLVGVFAAKCCRRQRSICYETQSNVNIRAYEALYR